MPQIELKARHSELINKHGAWTAHNIDLGDGMYTFAQDDARFQAKLEGHGRHLRRILQITSDLVDKPMSSLRVLDLGCLEGLYSIEFARKGAQVVGIEGREANIEKALSPSSPSASTRS